MICRTNPFPVNDFDSLSWETPLRTQRFRLLLDPGPSHAPWPLRVIDRRRPPAAKIALPKVLYHHKIRLCELVLRKNNRLSIA